MNKITKLICFTIGIVVIMLLMLSKAYIGTNGEEFVLDYLNGDVLLKLFSTIVLLLICLYFLVILLNAIDTAKEVYVILLKKKTSSLLTILKIMLLVINMSIILPCGFSYMYLLKQIKMLNEIWNISDVITVANQTIPNLNFMLNVFALVLVSIAMIYVFKAKLESINFQNLKSLYSLLVDFLHGISIKENERVEKITPCDINLDGTLDTLQYHLYQNKILSFILPFINFIFLTLCLLCLFDIEFFWFTLISGVLTFVCKKYDAVAVGSFIYFISKLIEIRYHLYFGTLNSIASNLNYYFLLCTLGYGLRIFYKSQYFLEIKEKYNQIVTINKKTLENASTVDSLAEDNNETNI